MKKIMALVVALFLFNATYALEILEMPTKLSVENRKSSIILSFQNTKDALKKKNIVVEVDLRGDGDFTSKSGKVLSYKIKDERERIEIKKSEILKLTGDSLNHDIRLRYRDGKKNSRFSSVVTFGEVPIFRNYDKWAEKKLLKAQSLGIIPDSIASDMKKNITREEFAELLVNYSKVVENKSVQESVKSFLDTDSKHANAARDLKLMVGLDGYFRPKDPVKRFEAAAVLNKLMKNDAPTKNKNISDIDSFDDHIKEAINRTVASGIFALEKNKFNPMKLTTRQAAVFQIVCLND